MQILTLLFWVLGAKRISSIKKIHYTPTPASTRLVFPKLFKKAKAWQVLFWNGQALVTERKKKKEQQRGGGENEFHQNIWSFSVDMPCLQLPTPTQKRATFRAVEKTHERLSLLCTPWNGIFSGGRKKTTPKPINCAIHPEGTGAIPLWLNRPKEVRGAAGQPQMETKTLCPAWDKPSEQKVCLTKTNSLSTCMYYWRASSFPSY